MATINTGDITLVQADGTTVIAKSGFPATTYTDPDPRLLMTSDVYEKFKLVGGKGETGIRLKFKAGSIIRTSTRDALYALSAATFTSCTPATAAHGATQAVVIIGTNFDGVTGVSFGSNAGTAFSVVDDKTIHVTAPTQSGAGNFNIVIHDDAGDLTVTNGWVAS